MEIGRSVWQTALAIRAIASANGKNKLWIVVPCHRIIGKNGELNWLCRWFVAEKVAVLQHEAIVVGKAQTELLF